MKAIRHDLVALKIAREDLQPDRAGHFGKQLAEKLDTLGKSCDSCHKDPEPKERILGTKTKEIMTKLQLALKEPGKTKKSGGLLGELGFSVCGRCHGVHRSSSEIKRLLK